MKWEVVCLDKKRGGLGVKKLSIFNKALLCKWSWQFMIERDAFRNQIMRGKYEEQGGWCAKFVRTSYGVGVWKAIRKEWEVLARRLVFEVGDGARVLLWKHKWCGLVPLCVAFPSLYAIADSKNALVNDVWSPEEEGDDWNPLFLRLYNDWEMEDVNNCLSCLSRKIVQPSLEDKVVWWWRKELAVFCGILV